MGECAPDRLGGEESRAEGLVLRGPGTQALGASWSQGRGLEVGEGEGTLLEAAAGASAWALPEVTGSLARALLVDGCGSGKKPDPVVGGVSEGWSVATLS